MYAYIYNLIYFFFIQECTKLMVLIIMKFHGSSTFKGQLILKANCQAVNSSKKQTNGFIFTSMRRDFVRFWKNPRPEKNVLRLPDL